MEEINVLCLHQTDTPPYLLFTQHFRHFPLRMRKQVHNSKKMSVREKKTFTRITTQQNATLAQGDEFSLCLFPLSAQTDPFISLHLLTLCERLLNHICSEEIYSSPLFIAPQTSAMCPIGRFSSLWSDSVDSLQKVHTVHHWREKRLLSWTSPAQQQCECSSDSQAHFTNMFLCHIISTRKIFHSRLPLLHPLCSSLKFRNSCAVGIWDFSQCKVDFFLSSLK